MENRKEDKIKDLNGYLVELEEILPKDLNEYLTNFEKKAACERYFEKIIEAVIDLAFLIIKENKFRNPNSERDALKILFEEEVIGEGLSIKISEAKSMRNIIIHEYGNIDDELVFDSLTKELIKDVHDFIGGVLDYDKKKS